MDVECLPIFCPAESALASIVQISTKQTIYIIDVQSNTRTEIFEQLQTIITNPNIIKLGIELSNDIRFILKKFGKSELVI